MKSVFLGIDTSNYRTSICVITVDGEIVFERKELIPVELGERGMMQSEALFHHLRRLPELFSELPLNDYQWLAVGASTKPRPIEGSYMPVFRVGENMARFSAIMLGIPFYETSHQEGHIAAALYSSGNPIQSDAFLAFHISGGTTELLRVQQKNERYEIELLGGTTDLHAGQFVDRIGVLMGLPFPAGPKLEELAQKATGNFTLPSSVDGYMVSFSGPESAAKRAIAAGVNHAEVALSIQKVICNSIEKVVRKAVLETGLRNVLFVGGVASNQYIKQRLQNRLEHPAIGAKLYFTTPEYSGDNAYGVACIAKKRYMLEHNV